MNAEIRRCIAEIRSARTDGSMEGEMDWYMELYEWLAVRWDIRHPF